MMKSFSLCCKCSIRGTIEKPLHVDIDEQGYVFYYCERHFQQLLEKIILSTDITETHIPWEPDNDENV